VAIQPGVDLAGLVRVGRLAMADPESVPAGKYGRAALEKLGIWNSVRGAVASVENPACRPVVRVAPRSATRHRLRNRRRGRSPGQGRGRFPEDTHPPIICLAALTADSKNPRAARLLEFLGSPAVTPVFEKEGFTVLG
jgi:molybdate transport system substrate-binding protein